MSCYINLYFIIIPRLLRLLPRLVGDALDVEDLRITIIIITCIIIIIIIITTIIRIVIIVIIIIITIIIISLLLIYIYIYTFIYIYIYIYIWLYINTRQTFVEYLSDCCHMLSNASDCWRNCEIFVRLLLYVVRCIRLLTLSSNMSDRCYIVKCIKSLTWLINIFQIVDIIVKKCRNSCQMIYESL